MLQLKLEDEAQTSAVAAQFAQCIKAPCVITLNGVIGAGKTTFVRGFLRAIGIAGAIKSPTFSLVESYEKDELTYHHFDLYRILEEAELEYIGFRDYFSDASVIFIEWPERMPLLLDKTDLDVCFTPSNNGREFCVIAKSKEGQEMLSLFSKGGF